MTLFAQILANGLVTGSLYALLAVGFALIYNTTRIFHLAHGATYTVAAYLCLFLVRNGWSLPAAIVTTLLLTAALGAGMEALVYAPLARQRASLLVALLSSLGLYLTLVNGIALIFGNESQVLRPGNGPTYQWGPLVFTQIQIAEVLSAAVLLPLLLWLLRFTRLGTMIRAARDHATLLTVVGGNLAGVRLTVFALGSALAGAAAILSAMDQGFDPQIGMPALLVASVALIVGGVGSFSGAVAGAVLLGAVQSMVIWKFSARWIDAVTFSALMLVLILRPRGLFAGRRRAEERET